MIVYGLVGMLVYLFAKLCGARKGSVFIEDPAGVGIWGVAILGILGWLCLIGLAVLGR